MADSHPYDWIRTLEAAALDFDAVITGHGDVMRYKDRFGTSSPPPARTCARPSTS